MSPGPPLYRSSSGLLLPQSVDGPSHVKSSSPSLHHSPLHFSASCSLYPDDPVRVSPAAAVCSVRCGYSRPTVRSSAACREGSTASAQSPAASPRPRRSGPSLARQPASLLLVWTYRGLAFSQAPMAAAADSRTLLRCVRDLPPTTSQTALPCGPRSSKLPGELLTLV